MAFRGGEGGETPVGLFPKDTHHLSQTPPPSTISLGTGFNLSIWGQRVRREDIIQSEGSTGQSAKPWKMLENHGRVWAPNKQPSGGGRAKFIPQKQPA